MLKNEIEIPLYTLESKDQGSNRGSIMHILYFNTQNVETQIENYAINSIVDNNCTSILFSVLSLGK